MATEDEKDTIPSCSVKQLTELLRTASGYLLMPSEDYNEISSGIFIGSRFPALDKPLLTKLGITHVLNAAQGNSFMHVDTSAEYYEGMDIKYLGLCCNDMEKTKISKHFDEATDFIAEAVGSGGKILVHCVEGFSRSATLVIAYFMIKKGMTAQAAVGFVRASREIGPNDGFLKQLCELNEQLEKKRKVENVRSENE